MKKNKISFNKILLVVVAILLSVAMLSGCSIVPIVMGSLAISDANDSSDEERKNYTKDSLEKYFYDNQEDFVEVVKILSENEAVAAFIEQREYDKYLLMHSGLDSKKEYFTEEEWGKLTAFFEKSGFGSLTYYQSGLTKFNTYLGNIGDYDNFEVCYIPDSFGEGKRSVTSRLGYNDTYELLTEDWWLGAADNNYSNDIKIGYGAYYQNGEWLMPPVYTYKEYTKEELIQTLKDNIDDFAEGSGIVSSNQTFFEEKNWGEVIKAATVVAPQDYRHFTGDEVYVLETLQKDIGYAVITKYVEEEIGMECVRFDFYSDVEEDGSEKEDALIGYSLVNVISGEEEEAVRRATFAGEENIEKITDNWWVAEYAV